MIIFLGIPIAFAIGIIWGGVIVFKRAQQPEGNDPFKYRS